jgi:hypothetical protein
MISLACRSANACLFGWKRIGPHPARGTSHPRKSVAGHLDQAYSPFKYEASIWLHIGCHLPQYRVSRNENWLQNDRQVRNTMNPNDSPVPVDSEWLRLQWELYRKLKIDSQSVSLTAGR